MSKLIEVLQHVQKRPQMYFVGGEEARSIHLLEAFIVGFQSALVSLDVLLHRTPRQ